MDDYIVSPEYFDIACKQIPSTPMEALMVADFGEEVQESSLEREARKQELNPLIEGALAQLTELERVVVEGCVLEGVSLRRLSRRLGTHSKSGVAKIRDRGLTKMREYIEQREQ